MSVLPSSELPARIRARAERGGRLAVAAIRYLALRLSIPIGYAARPLDDLLASLGGRRRRLGALPVEDLIRVVRSAERVAPRITSSPNTCLFRALARFALLAEHGHRPVFVLGVKDGLEFPGHAWVEIEGRPFLEPGPPPFVSVFRQGVSA